MLARTGPHSCNIHKIARAAGVRLHEAADNRSTGRRAGDCYCKPTVKAIGRAHGEGHLSLVLKLINESGNGRELHAATITAVSMMVLSGLVRVDGSLYCWLDTLDLGKVRERAKAMPGGTAENMAAILIYYVTGFDDLQRKAA